MASFSVYKLHFTSPLHIGNEREDYGTSLRSYPSDSLYSALIASLASVGVEIPENGDLGYAVSSMFPFYQDNEKPVYFFPKPLTQEVYSFENISRIKSLKKTEWLDLHYFQKKILGHNLFGADFEDNDVSGKYLSKEPIDEYFISSSVKVRVQVPRQLSINGEKQDADPFYMDRLEFKGKSGLFFLADGNTQMLEKGLNILSKSGIGTDRTVGHGFFNWEKDVIEIKLPTSDHLISLSVYIPKNSKELNAKIAKATVAYDLIKRGGWITTEGHSTLRKNSIYAFREGSVFSSDSNDSTSTVAGKTVDLKPEMDFNPLPHPVYRVGKAIMLPFQITIYE